LPNSAETNYVAVVGRNAAWPGDQSRRLDSTDFPGGESQTILLVETRSSGIAWTEPRDLSLDALESGDGGSSPILVTSQHGQQEDFFFKAPVHRPAIVETADGKVHFLPSGLLAITNLRKMLQFGGFREEEVLASNDSLEEQGRLNWPNIAALAVWLLSVGTLLTHAVRSRRTLPSSPAR